MLPHILRWRPWALWPLWVGPLIFISPPLIAVVFYLFAHSRKLLEGRTNRIQQAAEVTANQVEEGCGTKQSYIDGTSHAGTEHLALELVAHPEELRHEDDGISMNTEAYSTAIVTSDPRENGAPASDHRVIVSNSSSPSRVVGLEMERQATGVFENKTTDTDTSVGSGHDIGSTISPPAPAHK